MVDTGVLRHVDGFEIGGLELAQATQGSPSILGSIASPAGRSGAFALRLNPASTQEQYDTWATWNSGGSFVDGGVQVHRLYGFAVRFSDLAPGTEYTFASYFDNASTPLVVASLTLEAGGDLRFENQAGATVLTEGSPFTANQWHYLEVSLEGSATGDYEIWLDGVSLGSGTSDFISSFVSYGYLRLGGAGTGDGNVDFDDIYVVSHTSTLQGNNLGPSEVFAYQVDAGASAAADSGLTTNDDALDIGSSTEWNRAAQTPLNSPGWAGFSGSPADGARIFDEDRGETFGHNLGPTSGAYTVDGTIQGAMWLGVYQRGTGGGSSHVQWYGEGSQSPINSYTMDAIDNSVDTFRAVVSEDAGPVPTASQSFAMGAGTTGAQNIEIREQWAFLLHTPSAAGPQTIDYTGLGLAVAAAFGVPTLAPTQDVTPGGLAVPASFGVPDPVLTIDLDALGLSVPAAFGVSKPQLTLPPPGFGVPASFGAPTIVPTIDLSALGLAVAAAFGGPTLLRVEEFTPPSLSVPVAFGVPSAASAIDMTGQGFNAPVSVGVPSIVLTIDFDALGFNAPASFGVPVLALTQDITPGGFNAPVAFGVPDLVLHIDLDALGFNAVAAFGIPTLVIGSGPQTIVFDGLGLAVAASFGVPTLAPTQDVTPGGLAVPVSFGVPNPVLAIVLDTLGLSVPVGFGTPVLAPTQDVTPSGLAVPVSFGVPALVLIVIPAGLGVDVGFGVPVLVVAGGGGVLVVYEGMLVGGMHPLMGGLG